MCGSHDFCSDVCMRNFYMVTCFTTFWWLELPFLSPYIFNVYEFLYEFIMYLYEFLYVQAVYAWSSIWTTNLNQLAETCGSS